MNAVSFNLRGSIKYKSKPVEGIDIDNDNYGNLTQDEKTNVTICMSRLWNRKKTALNEPNIYFFTMNVGSIFVLGEIKQ